ncbi:MAG: hypothetical protein DRN08_05265 [Thermoplasmata archaeon]|nr:MAG: hypothetical protein DRN08_05265 [Thermoplasmata archaeon]
MPLSILKGNHFSTTDWRRVITPAVPLRVHTLKSNDERILEITLRSRIPHTATPVISPRPTLLLTGPILAVIPETVSVRTTGLIIVFTAADIRFHITSRLAGRQNTIIDTTCTIVGRTVTIFFTPRFITYTRTTASRGAFPLTVTRPI